MHLTGGINKVQQASQLHSLTNFSCSLKPRRIYPIIWQCVVFKGPAPGLVLFLWRRTHIFGVLRHSLSLAFILLIHFALTPSLGGQPFSVSPKRGTKCVAWWYALMIMKERLSSFYWVDCRRINVNRMGSLYTLPTSSFNTILLYKMIITHQSDPRCIVRRLKLDLRNPTSAWSRSLIE